MPGIPATVLTNVNISDTFYGVLHAGGQPIAATGQAQIYDGNGGITSLKLGIDCNGATICGGLSATTLSATNLSLSTPILSSILPNVTPNPAGTYTGYLTGISVTSKGIVTGVSATPTLPLQYKASAVFSYTGSNSLNAPQNWAGNPIYNNTNIQSIEWVKAGLYRVYFVTPMSNANYNVIIQKIWPAAGAGQYPHVSRTGANHNKYQKEIIQFISEHAVTYKTTAYFEFFSAYDYYSGGYGLNFCNLINFSVLVL